MIDVNELKVGDKLRVLCEGLKDLPEIEEVVTVVDYYLGDHGNLWIDGDKVTLEALSEHDEDRFELVKEELDVTESAPWKIQVLTSEHEYQGLYKGSIHTVKTLKGDNSVQFYHNGKLWALDAEDYDHYVEQPLSEEKLAEMKKVVDLFIPENSESSALDKQEGGGHYKGLKIQPVEYIHANGLSYLEGNVIKYTTRHKSKNKEQDIKKAIHYLELILELEYGNK